ncbi:hypothetical protein [Bradyrhizobium sp.]|uniref:hypothetical protein n=1 Tax=Bradyrhizobium sp. TaxID=376 RepID=UPI001DA3CC07|nr:hypothetical protein [Bradyrhizobium sp.]MBV8696643.1 hypothetical protein [Bradyrhizobium sp.]MBV8919340.1 hypothetical protein [Bradyrhizobium sp.]MBV9979398.1 hypothetical protein [Bradyrhizobium sp.]
MAPDSPLTTPIARDRSDDMRLLNDLQHLDDEFDFPSWIRERPPEISELQELSSRNSGPNWVIMSVGLIASLVAGIAILWPLAHSVLQARRSVEQTVVAQSRALPLGSVREEQRAQPAAPEFAPARQKLVEDPSRLAAEPAAASTPQAVVATAVAEPPKPPEPDVPAMSAGEVGRMLARAAALIREGQIGSARALLELAARSRDPATYLALADTYNPKMLARWHAIGIPGDRPRALSLYQQAADAGMTEANARLRELGR